MLQLRSTIVCLLSGLSLAALTAQAFGQQENNLPRQAQNSPIEVVSGEAPQADLEQDVSVEIVTEVDDEQLQEIQQAAQKRNSAAQYTLGEFYRAGVGVEQDYAKAAEWYEKAADQGDPDAQYMLGILKIEGDGNSADPEAGAVWVRKAAEQGLAEAQFLLGVMYYDALGVSRDWEQAEVWLGKAASQEHKQAAEALVSLRQQMVHVQEAPAETLPEPPDGGGAGSLVLLLIFLGVGKILSLVSGRKISGARGYLWLCLVSLALGTISYAVLGIMVVNRQPNVSTDVITKLVSEPMGTLIGQLLIPALIAYAVLRFSGERFRKRKNGPHAADQSASTDESQPQAPSSPDSDPAE
ncbi:tetratricopeptide repeat protein [Rubinisphaera brasiliensis]|uniref:Sel1 domain protein repeat-containing protein n=1 Tax=Rubinisphaera brasiliensis (strain ATCC 49424 / DSM 5305 / JCM 21570 / IAM 15109 / NBRC 103401 / IFAM 1448) TaxID=756272 RepID=F0SR33_RUBBR|nr:tetratricopeptide repeat protein [Rubinisphaera brasiliensis]ADY61280.1 Sel1 domain protein repeat-containing protein [Rubinisphaera brasiliensis DSM 5305]